MSKFSVKPQREEMQLVIPKNHLRKKIGMGISLDQIFMAEDIRRCQDLVDSAHTQFLVDIEAQIRALGAALMQAEDDAELAKTIIERTAAVALLVKKRMESLGFPFGFKVAESLCDYMHTVAAYSPDVMLIICKHIAMLSIAIKQGIAYDGGPTGQETLDKLKILIRKIES